MLFVKDTSFNFNWSFFPVEVSFLTNKVNYSFVYILCEQEICGYPIYTFGKLTPFIPQSFGMVCNYFNFFLYLNCDYTKFIVLADI